MTFSLYIQMLHNCLAYFSRNQQIRNWRELCSLYVHYFPRVFLSVYFYFPCQIRAHAQFFGKFKTDASRLYDLVFIINFIFNAINRIISFKQLHLIIWTFLPKVQPQGVAQLLLKFLPVSVWCCLWKVLLIKNVYYTKENVE